MWWMSPGSCEPPTRRRSRAWAAWTMQVRILGSAGDSRSVIERGVSQVSGERDAVGVWRRAERPLQSCSPRTLPYTHTVLPSRYTSHSSRAADDGDDGAVLPACGPVRAASNVACSALTFQGIGRAFASRRAGSRSSLHGRLVRQQARDRHAGACRSCALEENARPAAVYGDGDPGYIRRGRVTTGTTRRRDTRAVPSARAECRVFRSSIACAVVPSRAAVCSDVDDPIGQV